MDDSNLLATYLRAVGAEPSEADRDGFVSFSLHGCEGLANVKDGGGRLRARVVLDTVVDIDSSSTWLDSQPSPPSAQLELWTTDDGGVLRMVWERALVADIAVGDSISEDVAAYVAAWADKRTADAKDPHPVAHDPRDVAPEQAWLLVADDESWPHEGESQDAAGDGAVGIFDTLWTCAKQTQPGDLVMVYFMGQRKAAHFVARAASRAFYTAEIDVNAKAGAAPRNEQWWAYLTPLVQIEPIPFATLKAACDGQLILKGRSGKFLRPSVVDGLAFHAVGPGQREELERVVRTPTGRADLPDPRTMSWQDVRDLAAGALALESDVSTYVVRPLLDHCLTGSGLTYRPEYPVGRARADFVVLRDDAPRCVVEVKLAVRTTPDWAESPDLQQTLRYAQALDCPAVLIDANRIVLIDAGATTPRRTIERRHLRSGPFGSDDLHDLAEHLGVPDVRVSYDWQMFHGMDADRAQPLAALTFGPDGLCCWVDDERAFATLLPGQVFTLTMDEMRSAMPSHVFVRHTRLPPGT